MKGACEAGNLTPEGVVEAMRKTSELDLDGLLTTSLDYTDSSQPPTRTVFISRADADTPGGLKLGETFEGPSGKGYTFK